LRDRGCQEQPIERAVGRDAPNIGRAYIALETNTSITVDKRFEDWCDANADFNPLPAK
jgi:hypothetical protein